MGLFGTEITGVDIGAGSIKVVRIAGGKRPKLLAARLVDFAVDQSLPTSVSTDLRFLRTEKKLWTKRVVTLMPGKHLTIRHLTLPKMPAAEVREAVQWESKRHISYPLDAAVIEHLIVGEKSEGSVEKFDVLMVAAAKDVVLQHLLPFTETGIALAAVDANALALRNVIRRRISAKGNVLVVDMGAGKTEINVFKEGGLRFSRCLETGGVDMTRYVADELGLSMREAEDFKMRIDVLSASDDRAVAAVKTRLDGLLLEIRRSVEYYKTTHREKTIERTVLTGGGALLRGIGEYFGASLEGSIELDAPFSGLGAKQKLLEEFGALGPRFSAAIGLALRSA